MTERTLPDQILESKLNVQRLLLSILGFMIVAIALCTFGIHQLHMSDPYVHKVFTLEGNIAQGNAMFQLNCAGCHGNAGQGNVGPSLHDVAARRSTFSLIQQISSGKTPPMPEFQASPQEMADLLSFLETL